MNKSFFAASFSIVRIIFFIGLIVYFISLMNIPLVNEILANVEKLSNALFGDGADGSLGTRNSQLSIALNNFYKSPIWGRGPLKGSIDPIEIQLGYYISSWGLMGITIYLTIMSLFLYYAWQTRSGVGDIGSFSKANFIWILCSFIIGLSTPITDQIRVSQFFWVKPKSRCIC